MSKFKAINVRFSIGQPFFRIKALKIHKKAVTNKMQTLSRYIKKLTIIFILSIGLLTGCSSSDGQDITIDTSEVQITGEGLELLGVEIEDDVVLSIKNDSGNKYNMVGVYLKIYDESGAVIDTRPGIGEKIDAGEEFKVKIPFYSNFEGIGTIKVTEIYVPGYSADGTNDGTDSDNTDADTDTSTTSEEDTLENVVIKCAQTLVYDNIKTPGTARWVSAEVLGQDNYGRYLVDIIVDAENGYGALIRSGFIVALQSVQEDGHFTRSAMFFMKEYSKEYEREQAIKFIKDLNDWDEDPDQLEEEEEQSAA